MRKPDNVVMFKDNKEIIVQPILWLNDSRAMRECAILGIGIVKLHDYIATDALQDGRLIEVLSEFQEPQLPVYLYYQQSRYLQPKIRKFIDFKKAIVIISAIFFFHISPIFSMEVAITVDDIPGNGELPPHVTRMDVATGCCYQNISGI